MSDLPPPWSLGTEPRAVALSGKVFPFEGTLPVFFGMPGTTALYLPCFTNVEDLRRILTRLQIKGYTIKHIDDGLEFAASIPSTTPDGRLIHIILDPWYTERGTIRFSLIVGQN